MITAQFSHVSSGWLSIPDPNLVGSWHCDSHRSMCLVICFLTVSTASGDVQFEESPSDDNVKHIRISLKKISMMHSI
jgi:hypothetical protein